jgi:hypothetical protein
MAELRSTSRAVVSSQSSIAHAEEQGEHTAPGGNDPNPWRPGVDPASITKREKKSACPERGIIPKT